MKINLTPRRLIAAFLGVLSLVLVFMALLLLERWRWQLTVAPRVEARSIDFDKQLQQFAVIPSILSRDPRLELALQSTSENAINAANQALRFSAETSDTAAIFVMDETGNTIAASNYDQAVSFIGQNYKFRPYFKGAIAGQRTTFFAVGATTGIPGYFIATPIHANASQEILGIVVVKIEPQTLPAAWDTGSAHAVVTDELGTVILASDQRFLYSASTQLSSADREIIESERRYSLDSSGNFSRQTNTAWKFDSKEQEPGSFQVISKSLSSEPWQLHTLQSNSVSRWRAVGYLSALLALACITLLLMRIYRQRRQLAQARAEQAKKLELLVLERTRALEDAQQALIAESNFSMLGRMSAAINHEINQPLASLRLNIATLRRIIDRQENPDDDIQEIVVESDRTTKRIGRVIETLRSFARQSRSGFESVNMQAIANDAVETVKRERPLAKNALFYKNANPPDESNHDGNDHRLNPEKRLCSANADVAGNEVLLQQAVLNLLYNAHDAVVAKESDAPHVEVEVKRQGSSVDLIVSDNGRGISAEMRERLFKPFESESGNPGGLGLGLTLAEQIAKDHNGSLVCSDADGGGCVFTLTLPALS